MKQEQLISYSLLLLIVIPLIVTTLGGMIVLSSPVIFYRYAKFLYGLTISLGLLLFVLKNFRTYFAVYFIFAISVIESFFAKKGFLFNELHPFLGWVLIFVFYLGIGACIKYIFLSKSLRAVRTLLFSVMGAVVFTVVFIALQMLVHHQLHKTMLFSDFSMGFMLFAIIGIGFLFSDMIINGLAYKFNLRPDLQTPLPHVELGEGKAENMEEPEKDENDQVTH